MAASTYEQTRQAWRNIWQETDFARELATLDYPRARELLNLYLPYLDRTLPVLEAGCGPGHVVYHLRQHGYAALGLDYAPEALLPTRAQFPDLPLHLGDVHHLPYAANSFGAYLSFGVVEHFEEGPVGALREAFRVLKPKGILVLTTPTPNFVDALRKLADRLISARRSRPPRAEYYETAYTGAQLAEFCRSVGFCVLKVVPYSHSFTFYGLHRIFRGKGYYQTSGLAELMGKLGRLIAPQWTAFAVLVIAQKPLPSESCASTDP
ncbi:MAG: class I SAM-dependent methyltransferase [Anaerolineae bacterium]|nr:class I SAM-dependent methyltransferase [Anaerolineae bacterium]MDW8299224.1 class I SAM-dependent methyltransferase [Anaerolineae bacterium]